MIFSIATDALHGLPRRRKVHSERYYYSSDKLFEQSLDVYRPAASTSAEKNDSKDKSATSPPPVVALVVGSAWLGHRAWVYSGTSWWNSSGPKAVAELGYVCVCIRHRGQFMKSLSILTIACVAIMAAMMVALLNALLDDDAWNLLERVLGDRFYIGQMGGFLLALATGIFLMELGGYGSASFDDMQHDVLDALAWLKANENKLGLKTNTLVFGGYSSGGHVAATVTQQPQLWKEHNLPPPHVHCDCMLYISPVLSTKSYHEILSRSASSISSSSSLPSLSPSESSTSEKLSGHSSMTEMSSMSTNTPTWLTDQVVKAVFGHAVAPNIPSPILTYNKSPSIPHVFLGCHQEMFGLNWLDTFFCSPVFSELLNGLGIESRYTAVRSDHWNILNSSQFSDALKEELSWVRSTFDKDE